MKGKAWANRHFSVWVSPKTKKQLTPGRVLFRDGTELVANRLSMDGDITWTILIGAAQRRPYRSGPEGRKEELEGLKRSLMEGREIAERLRSVKKEPVTEEGQRQATKERMTQSAPSTKKEEKKAKVIVKKQGTQVKKERPRGLKKDKKEPPAVE